MHPYPHTYLASSSAEGAGLVLVSTPEAPNLDTAAPPQFDGPGGTWSPETLLCAALADCFILTFRAVARAARFEWLHLYCRVEGVLERVDSVPQFTRCTTFATLTVSPGADHARAHELLERAERGCLIGNSLRATRGLKAQVATASRTSVPQAAEPAEPLPSN